MGLFFKKKLKNRNSTKKFHLIKYLKKLRKKILIFSLALGLNYFLPILLSNSSAMASSLASIVISSEYSKYHQINENNLIVLSLFLLAIGPEAFKYLGVLILTWFLLVSGNVSKDFILAFSVSLFLFIFCNYNLGNPEYSKLTDVLIPITFLLIFYWHLKLRLYL